VQVGALIGGTAMARGTAATRDRRWWGVATLALACVALLAAGRAAVTMIYLGFRFRAELDPIRTPASYYVFLDGGRAPFNTTVVALAIGVLAVLVGMAWAGVRLAGRPTVLFVVWAACLLLAAIFPTDDSPDIETFGGWVHQFAGAGILALLSFAGLAAAPRFGEQPAWQGVVGIVRVLSIGAATLATLYVLTRIAQMVPALFALIGGIDVGGMLQRLVFGFDIAVITALAIHLVRVSWVSVRDRGEAAWADPGTPLQH
jgi:Protein of unknown function (DUF998)